MKTNIHQLSAMGFAILMLLGFSVPNDCTGQSNSKQDNSKRHESKAGYALPSNGNLRPGNGSNSKGTKRESTLRKIFDQVRQPKENPSRQEKKSPGTPGNTPGQSSETLPDYIGPPVERNQKHKKRNDRQDIRDNLPSNIREGLGIIGPINLQILPGSIVVTGPNPDDVRKVELLVNELMESATKTRPQRRIVKLEKAHAEYVAKWAQHLYDRNFESRQGSVTITAKSQSEIFLVGAQSAIEEAEKIVSALDK